MLLRSHDTALLRVVLDAVDVEDEPKGLIGGFLMTCTRIKELPTDVGEAGGTRPPVDIGDAIVPRVPVDDEHPRRSAEDLRWRLSALLHV